MTAGTQQSPVAHPDTSNIAESDNATRLESQPTASPASTTELARTKISLRAALRKFPDFPIPGIDFLDILPLFASPSLHESLIRALELQVLSFNNGIKPDVVVGLDARGFLFGPSLALRLGAGFAPVRKRGKLPGPTEEASFDKEYGQDFFQIQSDAVKKGQKVLVVDDIIATGTFSQSMIHSSKSMHGMKANVVRQVVLQPQPANSSRNSVDQSLVIYSSSKSTF